MSIITPSRQAAENGDEENRRPPPISTQTCLYCWRRSIKSAAEAVLFVSIQRKREKLLKQLGAETQATRGGHVTRVQHHGQRQHGPQTH